MRTKHERVAKSNQVLQLALNIDNFFIFPRFADDISTFMVNTLLNTTDIVMEHKAKKDLASFGYRPGCRLSCFIISTFFNADATESSLP